MCVSVYALVLTDFFPFLPFPIYLDILKQSLPVHSLEFFGLNLCIWTCYIYLAYFKIDFD